MWEKILGFASYCFNKSHSACYGLIAYWTAYMKANHYAAFMTANLIYEMDNKDKMTKFVEELRSTGIPVLPPDVNESGWEFTVIKSGADAKSSDQTQAKIRFGFGGVKAVGEGAAEHLIAERKKRGAFTSLFDLCERIDTRTVNKRVIESLIKVGALDSLHRNRRALFETQDRAFDRGHRLAKVREQNQQTLFATFETEESFKQETQGYPNVPDWSVEERLGFEKALTGYWMSSHPVTEHHGTLADVATHTAAQLAGVASGSPVAIAAVVLEKRVIRTKAGKTMAVLTMEDQFGRFEGVLFPGNANRRGEAQAGPYEKFGHDCEPDLVALFTGTVERRERRSNRPAPMTGDEGDVLPDADEVGAGMVVDSPAPEELPNLRIANVVPAHLVIERLTRAIVIAADAVTATDAATVKRLVAHTETAFKEHVGTCPVGLQAYTGGVMLTLALGERWKVHPSQELVGKLRAIWGADRVQVVQAGRETLLPNDSGRSAAFAGSRDG